MDWIDNDDESASMMILRGSAGVGKSALEQSISERCSKLGLFAAGFFFSRTSNRNNGNALIPTLARQLVRALPGLREPVEEELKEDSSLFKLTREAQMERLIVKHFQAQTLQSPSKSKPSTPQPRLIAIDGFDECSDPSVQHDLLVIIASELPRLGFPFRFLVATRPELQVMQTLHHHPVLQCDRVIHLNLNDTDATADIRTFFLSRFAEIRRTHPLSRYIPPSWPTEEDIDKLVHKASSQFIYASTVMNFISSLRRRPEDSLRVILGLSAPPATETPFARLDALYAHIFASINPDDLDTVNRVLGIIVLAAEHRLEFVPRLSGLEEVLSLRRGEIDLALIPLASIISTSSPDQPIEVLHASLLDFILTPARSGPFALNLGLAHETLAKWNWRNVQLDMKGSYLSNLTCLRHFLRHSRTAPLSDEMLGFLHSAAHLLGDMLTDERWALFYFQDLDEALIRMGQVFARKDFFCNPACRRFLLPQFTLSHLFGTEPPRLLPILRDLTGALQVFKVEEKNISQNEVGRMRALHYTICAARLIHYENWIHKKPQTFGIAEIASSCVFSTLRSRSYEILGWDASDAAILLFVATLLPYCEPDEYSGNIVVLTIRGPIQVGPSVEPLLRTTPLELVDHQDVVDLYRREVHAYVKRVKCTLQPIKLELLEHLTDESDEYWRALDTTW